MIKKPFLSTLLLLFALNNTNCASIFEDQRAKRKVEQLEMLSNDFKLHKDIYSEYSKLFDEDISRLKKHIELSRSEINIIKSLSERFFVPPTRILFLFMLDTLPNIDLNKLRSENPKLAEKLEAIYSLHKKVNSSTDLLKDKLFELKYMEFSVDIVSNEFLDYMLLFKPILQELLCSCKHNVIKEHIDNLMKEKQNTLDKESQGKRKESNFKLTKNKFADKRQLIQRRPQFRG